MSIYRTIKCNYPDCGATTTEQAPSAGWPGWGSLNGLQDSDTRETELHLCPEHLKAVAEIIFKEV